MSRNGSGVSKIANVAVNFEFPIRATAFTCPINAFRRNQERPTMGEPVPVSKDRIWIDGCFDFGHHGIEYCDARLTGLRPCWSNSPGKTHGQVSRRRGAFGRGDHN